MEVLALRSPTQPLHRFDFSAGPILVEVKAPNAYQAKLEASKRLSGVIAVGEWIEIKTNSFTWLDEELCVA